MKLTDLKLAIVYVNSANREDLRTEVEYQLSLHEFRAERQPGVKAEWVRRPGRNQDTNSYARNLSRRLAIRRGFQTGADAVLILDDDIVIHDEFRERIEKIDLPDDWEIFYLGCRHLQRPQPAGPGLLRCAQATDHHAIVFRRSSFYRVMRVLSGTRRGAPREIIARCDEEFSSLQQEIPVYAAYPNLIWPAGKRNGADDPGLTNYLPDGRQNIFPVMMAGVDAEIAQLQPITAASASEINALDKADTGGAGKKEPPEELPASIPRAPASRGSDMPPGFFYLESAPKKYQLEEMFPERAFINLGRREDRRKNVEAMFRKHELAVDRFPAVDGRKVRNTRGHGPATVYACRLSHRLLIRQAKNRKAKAFLICEDDVVLHPKFRTLAEALQPPDDWGVIFFGCTHVETPQVVSPGWVRVKRIWSLHAYAVRGTAYAAVLKALNQKGTNRGEEGADVVLSKLADQIPMYAVYPNIAWQDEGYSDLLAVKRKHFRADGHQNQLPHVLRTTNVAMRDIIETEFGRAARDSEFLTPEAVHGSRRRNILWKMEDVFPVRTFINLDQRPDRRVAVEEQFRRQHLQVERFAAVRAAAFETGAGLSPGQMGCARSHISILDSAAAQSAAAVLIFEDDVVLHPHLREYCESTSLPEDWGILYLGCQHTEKPAGVVAPGLLRVTGAYSTHAYAVRGPHLKIVADSMRQGLEAGKPCDVVLAELQKSVPSYTFYPNLAWQAAGHSDLKRADAENYDPEGVQRWHRATLYQVDHAMRTFLNPDTGATGRRQHGPVKFKNFWRNFDYGQAGGKLGPGLALLFDQLQQSPLVIGSVFGNDPLPFDVVFSGECLPGLRHDGQHFIFKDILQNRPGKALWFMGIPSIRHPRALHVPLYYLSWAERCGNPDFAALATQRKEPGVSVVVRNLGFGGLAAKRAALAHELSKLVPVYGNRQLAAVAPKDSKMIYHDVPDKLQFVSRFTHNLCFENQSHAGYLTEKIFDAIHMGSLPLYYGDPYVEDWFDPRAFLDCTGRDAAEIAEMMHESRSAIDYVASAREKTCKVSLDEMRQRTADFQRLILNSL